MKKKILSAVFWLLAWCVLSLLINNPILLAGPVETAEAFAGLVTLEEFWLSVFRSILRMGGGLVTGSVLGIFLSVICWKMSALRNLLDPFVRVLKAIPVVSFVMIILIWSGNSMLSLWISTLVVLPIMYFQIGAGLRSLDRDMIEMADVFHMSEGRRLKYVILPGLKSYLMAGFQLAVGMCWKSGVAAEVIGQPVYSIGNGFYRAKINLDTGRLFAWTLTVLLLSFAMEKAVLWLLGKAVRA